MPCELPILTILVFITALATKLLYVFTLYAHRLVRSRTKRNCVGKNRHGQQAPQSRRAIRVTQGGRPIPGNTNNKLGQPQNELELGQPHRVAPTVGDVVNWFKTMTTNQYIRGVRQNGWPPFPDRLWQRNYYEHIIRNEDELNRFRRYIADNPCNWQTDKENPDVTS